MGKALGIRLTPTLEFILDALPDTAASIEESLSAARARDAEIAQAAKGASYAGESDPYRHDDEEDELDDEASDPDTTNTEVAPR